MELLLFVPVGFALFLSPIHVVFNALSLYKLMLVVLRLSVFSPVYDSEKYRAKPWSGLLCFCAFNIYVLSLTELCCRFWELYS